MSVAYKAVPRMRTALVLREGSVGLWVPIEFDYIQTGDLFVLVEPDGTEVSGISFAMSDARAEDPPSYGVVEAVELSKMDRDQALEMVRTIEQRAEGRAATAATYAPGDYPPTP